MAFTPIEARFGIQPIGSANVPLPSQYQSGQSPFFGKDLPLGTMVRAFDPVYGEGDFVYLQLPTTGNIGQLVTWSGYGAVPGDPIGVNEAQFQAVLTTNTATQGRAVGVLMSAYPPTPTNLAGAPVDAFGWVQIKGAAVVLSNGVAAAGSKPYLANSASAGTISTTATAGMEIWNATIIAAVGTPAAFNVASAVVVAGGSGYQVGDVLTVLGGVGVSAQAQLTVATLSGSAVATVTVAFNGYYTTAPTNPASVAGGHGTGATFTLTTAQPYCIAQIDRPFLPGIIT